MSLKNKIQFIEGSRAIALTIKNIEPDVVSAYPITPQTHIVEDLAKFKYDNSADYKYLTAESEFSAISMVLGASAVGSRVYTATSSQGLLFMTEVIYNIAGLRLPVVMTCANRAVSAPLSIWNDHQDAMSVRDAGWIMFFSENNQEAVLQHILAYKLAEKLRLPAMINVDGFILTHTYERVFIPEKKLIKKYLKKTLKNLLDTKNNKMVGYLATPDIYYKEREIINSDLINSQKEINLEYIKLKKLLNLKDHEKILIDNGLVEYYGNKKAKKIIIALGSVIGTIKDAVDELKEDVAVLKIKTLRPFPKKDILELTANCKKIIIIDKSVSLGSSSPLYLEVASIIRRNVIIKNVTMGLGGKDIKKEDLKKIISSL